MCDNLLFFLQSGECIDAELELEQLYSELTYDEIMCGVKPHFEELEPNGSRLQVDEAAFGSSSYEAEEKMLVFL